ncbi:TIGR02569 family protein [Streptomyces sp. NPDC047315]|uniref:TIGR02569 family protein n=1 Tax=Streptomyces sp. NPDC047315 TaxID=3155142 RepID=UPI0033CBEF3F
MDRPTAPSPAVLASFGAGTAAVPLPGGQGTTWRAGDVVLKPTSFATETSWRASVLKHVPEDAGFRVARPLPAADGSWSKAGWEAWVHVGGAADPHRPDEVVRAGEAFHAAIAGLPRPRFLDVRDNPWVQADRLAWGEREPVPGAPGTDLLAPLLAARRPVSVPAQLVHGDLLGNVLFEPGRPPAVIDWAPYWRPTAWATAVVVVDAVCWWDAERSLLDLWSHLPQWRQMLVRALVFRIATHTEPLSPTQRDAYAKACAWIL